MTLLQVEEQTQGELGGPASRRALQERIAAGEPFVLWVPVPAARLGWLWGQALLAERIYDRPLRDQLREWGWRPQSLTISDNELAVMSRQNLDRDPTEWGGGGLQPDLTLLLDVLAGGATPDPDQRLVLDLTIEQTGLPELTGSDLSRWRTRALACLLVTQAFAAAPELVGDGHELLIPASQRLLALQLLDRWLDSLRLSRNLPEAILEADRRTNLAMRTATTNLAQGPFFSRAAEGAVFAGTCVRLQSLTGRDLLETLAAMHDDLARHASGFWGDACTHVQAIPWGELVRLGRAAWELLEASPGREWATPGEAIAWYTGGGWRLDRAGEELLRNLTPATPELLTLITPLRAAFRARWEDTLIRWSALWSAAGCPLPAFGTAGEWLMDALQAPRATALIIADALRFDLGATLTARVNAAEGAERATLRPARAPLPSVTALGMATVMPIPERELEAELVAGKWQVRHPAGDSRIYDLGVAAERRAWWQARGQVLADAMLTLAELQARDLPTPAPGRSKLVIYDDAIDTLGHDDELEAQGSGVVLDRYLAVIRRLRDAGWLRILVATDHGYIQWPGSEETNAPAPVFAPAYTCRRALAYPADVTFDGPQALAPGGRWRVALPSGAACFRTYGGLGFFHGGASLQEWIIPCVTVEWPLQARPVSVALEPLAQVLSQRPRVVLAIQRGSLLLEDAIPRQVDVVVRDARSRTIVFRSPAVTVTPDRDQVSISLTPSEGVEASRGTLLRVEVRDSRTEEVLDAVDSVLSIELSAW